MPGGSTEYLDFWATCGVTQAENEARCVIPLVRPQRQLSGRSRGMAMNHVQCGLALGMAVGLGQVALHDQARAVLHQRMPDEA